MLDTPNEITIKKEREKAQKLRKSQWWKNQIHNDAKCYYCHKELTAKEATMDHIVPVSRGGHSTKGNIVIACKECNTLKKDMTGVEWTIYIEKNFK